MVVRGVREVDSAVWLRELEKIGKFDGDFLKVRSAKRQEFAANPDFALILHVPASLSSPKIVLGYCRPASTHALSH